MENDMDNFEQVDYTMWKNNVSVLYDSLAIHRLKWPSLSVSIIESPDNTNNASADYQEDDAIEVVESLLLGTHTSEGATNYIVLLDVLVPAAPVSNSKNRQFVCHEDYSGFYYGTQKNKFRIRYRIPHLIGEPNRIRCSYISPEIYATISLGGAVTIFDARNSAKNIPFNVEGVKMYDSNTISLIGHDSEGWGLCWSHIDKQYLVTGANDTRVLVWDINTNPNHSSSSSSSTKFSSSLTDNQSSCLNPYIQFEGHSEPVQDVVWFPNDKSCLMSVGDDGRFLVWDMRQKQPIHLNSVNFRNNGPLNTISINNIYDMHFATGGTNKDICHWDLRNPNLPIHTTSLHKDTITCLRWNHDSNHLASCSVDTTVHIWDPSCFGKCQTNTEKRDGPPELLFTHAAHESDVNDVWWSKNPNINMTLTTVGNDNEVHWWSIANHIYADSSSTSELSFETE